MKSFFGIILLLITLVALVGGGAFIWYVSDTAEFTRTNSASTAAPTPPTSAPVTIPRAAPVR